MGFSLYNLVKAGLLLTNAVAILHPQRFLGKCKFQQLIASIFDAIIISIKSYSMCYH